MARWMLAISAVVLAAGFTMGGNSAAVAADAWGCSYDKCIAYCTKVAGQRCSIYCTKKLQEKQLAKTCPAS